jgi:hypothetical protein
VRYFQAPIWKGKSEELRYAAKVLNQAARHIEQ